MLGEMNQYALGYNEAMDKEVSLMKIANEFLIEFSNTQVPAFADKSVRLAILIATLDALNMKWKYLSKLIGVDTCMFQEIIKVKFRKIYRKWRHTSCEEIVLGP